VYIYIAKGYHLLPRASLGLNVNAADMRDLHTFAWCYHAPDTSNFVLHYPVKYVPEMGLHPAKHTRYYALYTSKFAVFWVRCHMPLFLVTCVLPSHTGHTSKIQVCFL